jgi:hypothetical protein
MIFGVSFEIIIQRAVGNEPCYLTKNTLIITVLYNRSRKLVYFLLISKDKIIKEIKQCSLNIYLKGSVLRLPDLFVNIFFTKS